MKNTALVASITAALVSACSCFAQTPADAPPEKAAVIANDRAFEAAYAKADVKALADFFADDAEYTSEEGQTFSGRAQIEETLRAGLLARKGGKIAINPETVRVLSPDVVSEKGSTTVTGKNGDSNTSLYTAIHVKKDGKWKISQLVESPMPTVSPREHLEELAWLVGNWEEADKTNDLTVQSQYLWARGGNFLSRNVTVKRGGNVTLEGWQIVGWDPIEERIRTWTFDGEGGFAEGYYTREGERWLLRETGVAPESNNRTLDGDPQPSIGRVEINRVKGN
jgi:uncharacterized protein (TIGR02246 family)